MRSWPSDARRRLAIAAVVATACDGFVVLKATADMASPYTAVACTPDGTAVVVGGQIGLEVRSLPSLALESTVPTELTNVHDLEFSPDGTMLAVTGGEPAEEGAIELFRWPSQELLKRITSHDDLIYAVAWRSDSKLLATASGDQRVVVHRISPSGPEQILEGHSRGVLAAAFLPREGGLLTAGSDESVRLWDARSGATLRTLSNHTRPVRDLAVRPGAVSDDLLLVASAGDDRTVRFWQPTIGRLVRFIRLESAPQAIAWSSGGDMLWAVCRDGRLRGIDPADATLRENLAAINGVAYALDVMHDGNVIVAGRAGQLRRIRVDAAD